MVKKNKIEDLFSPFRCEEMPETADRIDGRTAVLDIISHRNGSYRSFIFFFFFFFIVLYHLLDLSPVRKQNESLISVI